MKRKMRRGSATRRSIQSKYEGSDASDDDYKIEKDGGFDDSDEYYSSLAEEELEDDVAEDVEVKKLRVNTELKRINGLRTKSRDRVTKASKKRKVSYKEDSDEHYIDDDGVDEEEEEEAKDWGMGFPKRKRNRVLKAAKECKNVCEAEDYANENDGNMWMDVPRKKRNGVKKAVLKKKTECMEEKDDAHETEDDECDDDGDDYNDNEDEKELGKGCLSRNWKVLKQNKVSSEEDDDDYDAEDDYCDDEDDYVDSEDEKELHKDCPTRKQKGVGKAIKKKKESHTEESDDDYEVEDDECDDKDDYENDELEEDEDEDEDFASDEIDFDAEDELAVKTTKKIRPVPSQRRLLSGGRKRRNNCRVISKSKRNKRSKRRDFQKKISSCQHKEATKGRRLVVDSDSDFVEEPLSREENYTMSEEEREQIQEASRFCEHLDVNLKNSSDERSRKEANLPQERKQKARKGKDKVEELKNEATKQVCGICFSEEGKRTVRGTLDCCNHYFCFNCIMDWSKVESRCPFCKQRFTKISKPGRSTVISVPERDQVYQPSEEELRAYVDPYDNVICIECHHGGDDANMLLCDLCDSPAHTYCVGLTDVPEGNWYCESCRPTFLGPSSPEAPTFTRNDNVRVGIDLNRAYEPETVDGIEMSSSSSALGVGVQTVSERRRRHQMVRPNTSAFVEWGRTRRLRFVFQNGTTPVTSAFDTAVPLGLGPEVEWGRTRRLPFQTATRPTTSSLNNTFLRDC